jgi:DNA-directed RNA polymerase specialized sigma24 family protein
VTLTLREDLVESSDLPRSDAVLQGRAEFLAPADRDLVVAVMIRGQPATELARLMESSDRAIRRRVNRLCRRLTSKPFLRAVRALRFLAEDEAKVAQLYFCHGLSQRRLARALGLSVHQLRRKLDHVSAKIDAIHRLSQEISA